MKILLDTQVWLWFFLRPERISDKATQLLSDPKNEVYFSAVSSWEIAIKTTLGKLELPEDPETYIPSRLALSSMNTLSIHHQHALRVTKLPDIHYDPFDRLLIAQAMVEKLSFLSGDPLLSRYPITFIDGRK